MGLRFKQQLTGSCFFVTTSFRDHVRFGEVARVYEVLAKSLEFCLRKYDAMLPAYVFMPSHLHLLIVIDGRKLGGFMRDFKKYTSQKGLREIGINEESIWEERYDRVAVYSESVFRQKLEYIHNNPVRANLVEADHTWLWSSAVAYVSDDPSPIPVWKGWLF